MLTGKRAGPERRSLEPPALEAVVKTCLAKDPDERWQTAREVKIALQPVSTLASVAQPARDRLYGAAIGVLAVLLIAALLFRRAPEQDQSLTRFAIYPPEKTTFSGSTVATVNVPQFALSPDGSAIVFAASTGRARPMLWLRTMDAVAARPLPGTENAQDPFWSPDGRWVGFFSEGKLQKIPVAGGAVQVVTQGLPDSFGGSWGPDDAILFSTGISPISRVSSAGGPVTSVTSLDSRERFNRWPQFPCPTAVTFCTKAKAPWANGPAFTPETSRGRPRNC
jgi:hypothetical protein